MKNTASQWRIAATAMTIVAVAGAFGAYEIGHNMGYSQGHKAGYSEGQQTSDMLNSLTQQSSANSQLQSCLDGVDKWYNANIGNQKYLTQVSVLDSEKQQSIQECQLRYPTN